MSKITVHIQVNEWPSKQDRTFCLDIDPLTRDAFQPLDFPSASSGLFCTPDKIVRQVKQQRSITANELSRAIVAAMRSADTYDGYDPVDPLTGIGRAEQKATS